MTAYVLFGNRPHDPPAILGVYLSRQAAERAREAHERTPAKFLFGYVIVTRDIGAAAKAYWE